MTVRTSRKSVTGRPSQRYQPYKPTSFNNTSKYTLNTVTNRNAYNASQAAYGSQDHHNRLLAQGYTHDKELSGTHQQTYYHPGTKHSIIGYRGTSVGMNGQDSDLSADAAITAGTHERHSAFKQAYNIHDQVQKKYGKNITVTGHSLGGTKAIESARHSGGSTKAVAFNPGTGVGGLDARDSTVIRRQGDNISNRVYGSNVHRLEAKGTGTLVNHSLAAFEDTFS